MQIAVSKFELAEMKFTFLKLYHEKQTALA